MKNCEFAEFGSLERAIPTVPRLNGVRGEFGCEVRIFRTAGAVEILAVAGLRLKPSITRWNGTLS